MARLIQEASYSVTVYAAALPPDTTSNVAVGQWHPFGHFDEGAVTPEWRAQFRAAADYSWRRFQIMVGEGYGIRWLPTFTQTRDGNPGPALSSGEFGKTRATALRFVICHVRCIRLNRFDYYLLTTILPA